MSDMTYVLLLIAGLFTLGASLAFPDKFYAASAVSALLGAIYFFRGIYNTMGVPDELVGPNDTAWIYTGLGLVVLGAILFGIGWLKNVRTSMPRR
ncbi:MAG: hypothetical protein QG549_764 [Patescibacteria group bacterium]|nr:hypothetical protein [Patescibacteria group bacterium]